MKLVKFHKNMDSEGKELKILGFSIEIFIFFEISKILKMLIYFFLHDEKIFFIPIFFSDLDYVSRVPEKYLEHSMTSSEEDIDRVWGAFS